MITAASVAVAVERVGMACTWPDSRSTSFWIMSKPAADGHCRQPGDPIHPDHPTAPRWQRQGMEEPARAAMLSFGALTRLARAQVLSDVAILAHPEGKEPDQRPRLGTPKMPPSGPSWQSRSTCARNLPPAGMQWRSAAPCLRRQRRPQRTRNVLQSVCGVGDGGAVSIDEPAQRCSCAAKDSSRSGLQATSS